MEKPEFEKQFLALINKSDLVITAPNVAYHLNLGIEEAQEHLLALELNGVLTQATDQAGGTYYVMPNRPAPGTPQALLEAGTGDDGGNRQAPGVYNPADLPRMPIYSTPSSGPAKGRNVNGLVFNILIPGLGSLVCGKMIGLAMLGLVILGLVLFFLLPGWYKPLGILPIVAGWIWSIVGGIMLLDDREPGPGVPARR